MKINLIQPAHQGVDFHARYADFPRENQHSGGKHEENTSALSTLTKTWMKLNLIVLLLLIGLSQVDARSYAQQITLKRQNSSLETILKEIEKQSGYVFFYKEAEVAPVRNISFDVKNMPLREALNSITDRAGFMYDIFEKTVVLKKVTTPLLPRIMNESGIREEVIIQQYIKGMVIDEAGKPIAGASIRLKSDVQKSVVSQANGAFSLPLSANKEVIIVSFVGFTTKEVIADVEKQPLVIQLTAQDLAVDEVVITGTGINRRKDSFTGTTAIFTGEDLKAVSNNNIIQSLRTLDPSFLMIENNLQGSNPNALPVIEVRGKSSIPSATLKDQFGSDPNQPLFVLDGFPTTLQTIVDLDMNRVASVSILKDAASTALYGSQASNGVVVIETIKPKSGELRFSYAQDFRLELPDLSAYNMMNAVEKLEFERLSGRYTASESDPTNVLFLEQLYSDHLANVKRGVDTYWLSEPLQTGYSTNSSINASGGDQAFTYNIGLNYRIGKGAMKGSGRDTYSGSINLTYRKKALNINNITYIRGYKSTESPYGSFETFVNTNPYFEKSSTRRYLDQRSNDAKSVYNVSNPLYDASLPQYNHSNNIEFQNNLNANYDINKAFKLNAALQITKGNTVAKTYKSAEMSVFESTPTLRKGKYTDDRANNFSYQANLMLSYQKIFSRKHVFNANWRNTISQNQNDTYSTIAEGFPEGNLGNPRFAYSYAENSFPSASNGIYRTLNTTLTANYAYDNRYLADVVYRLDGSTAYGSNKQYSPYYAVGLGWNLHNETFIKDKKWINSLRLTGNIGITGNQNFGNISSLSVFNYNSNTNYNAFGQGVSLLTLGNPDLKPQKTKQISTSVDFSLFNNRFTGYVNAYNKKTDPLIVPVDLPSSTGIFSYPYNVGNLTYNGLETKLTYFPIYNLRKRITWSIGISGSSYKSKYGGIGNTLNTLNKKQENTKDLLRYTDGNSAEAIWAVKSMGIDPATGREIFLTKEGQYTFDYETGNIVNVGNTVALAEGIISSNLRYKSITLGIALRYRVDGDVFNTALYDKVENISNASIANNQDRRALYGRWKNVGDVAQFKGISLTSTTPKSSRFVQNENSLSSESLNIGYTFENTPWVKSLGLKNLNLNVFGNDFLYSSTIRRERGIQYPYARTFAFSIKATF
ncbi:SusC/RagA family TonB-linked outer membrane protein [Sphingobacterium lumbrici]|uniref:SusC/RagA family TonB-linked outer membrane protein n=1 Tax=Sphingobacterium lumbrici TaxID=2559600 RepID=UPI0011264877|nr:SusC/RagA family TonB-linked outer membrane protein [Sphingobacterium lumbrici]